MLNLKEIFKTRNRFTGRYTFKPENIKLPPDMGELRKPLEVYVEITREKGGYRVYMEIEGSVVLECSRCLTLFEKGISKQENIRLEPYPNKENVYLKPSELDVSFYEDEEAFDLTNLVREQVILSIPTKPLCSPECSPQPAFETKSLTLGDLIIRSR